MTIQIIQIKKINGKVVEIEPDNREITTEFELESYRDELQKKHGCEIEFIFKTLKA